MPDPTLIAAPPAVAVLALRWLTGPLWPCPTAPRVNESRLPRRLQVTFSSDSRLTVPAVTEANARLVEALRNHPLLRITSSSIVPPPTATAGLGEATSD